MRITRHGLRLARAPRLSPAQAIIAGFVGAIALGTLLLGLPLAHAEGASVSWLEALFTATSAVCVTGLIVVDTGGDFSPFGQLVVMLLIKSGGLGILSLGALVALATGRRMGFTVRQRLQAQANAANVGGIVRFVRRVLLFTVSAELLGALALWPRLARDDGLWPGAWSALFHAVSALNNAGFSLYAESLERYAADAWISATVSGLFVVGGIGLVIVVEAALRWLPGERRRFTLHSRLALATTASLIVIGSVAFAALEWTNPATLGGLEARQRPLAAFFQAVTPRTAGFNTLPTDAYRDSTSLFTMVLMFIGGNPGSTAGGIKTTTFAVLVLATLAAARGRVQLTAFGRTIGHGTIMKAAVIGTLGMLIVGAAATFLMITDPDLPPVPVLFEVVSAFGTVGLSQGMTAALSWPGQLALVALMFVGRVGLLTVALALVEGEPRSPLRYPREDVVVG